MPIIGISLHRNSYTEYSISQGWNINIRIPILSKYRNYFQWFFEYRIIEIQEKPISILYRIIEIKGLVNFDIIEINIDIQNLNFDNIEINIDIHFNFGSQPCYIRIHRNSYYSVHV